MGRKKEAKKQRALEKKLRKLAKAEGRDVAPAGKIAAALTDVQARAQLPAPGEDGHSAVASVPVPASSPPPPSRQSPPAVDESSSYDVFDAIQRRRSSKRFVPRPVARSVLEVLLEAAVLAPNHKRTEPWGFVVFGDGAKRRYGEIRARLEAGRGGKKAEKREKIIEETAATPALIAVTMRVDADPVRREEDYAATFMGVQNLLLAGTALGLGARIKTGRIMDDGDLRELVGVRRKQRVVAILEIGYPAEERGPARRMAASEKTTWLD